MENRVEKAVALHKQGYNCAQAVLCAYCDLFGMDEETAFKISEGFGGGIGGMHSGVCGATSAVYMLAGLQGSGGSPEKGLTKAATYARIKELESIFQAENGSTTCRQLIERRTAGEGKSCRELVIYAAGLVERELLGEGK